MAAVAFASPEFDTDFDTGSVGRVTELDSTWYHPTPNDSIEVRAYLIRPRWDPRNPVDTTLLPSCRWFHFRMTGVRDKWIFMTIPYTEVRRPFYSYDGENYVRFDATDGIYPQGLQKIFTRDTVYIAYHEPYTHARHAAKLHEWDASPHVHVDTIGYSDNDRPVAMLTLTDTASTWKEKRRVWIHSRVHTSEAPAAWHLESLVDELLGETSLARRLRQRVEFYIVPQTNPDGVEGGYSRSTPTGVNMEVNWDHPDSLTVPEVRILKRTLDSLTSTGPFDVALNMHSQSTPFVTYWVHSARSTSVAMHRRKLQLSALTMTHTPYYRRIDQRTSTLAPRYFEGWMWDKFGEATVAVTFETPYSYYRNDPEGTWVSRATLKKLAHANLLALNDFFQFF